MVQRGLMEKQWRVHFDPTRTFRGNFSNEEFKIGLDKSIWPHNSIWYNQEDRGYYRVYFKQDLARIGSPKAWIQKLKEEAEYEKPPVGERQVYR